MKFPHPGWITVLVTLLAASVAGGQAPRPWNEYRAIMWVGDSASKNPGKLPLLHQRLREMGINAAMVTGDEDARHLLDARMPYYVENIVNRGLCLKWNSKVSDWDKMVTEWKTPRDEAGLVRDYSLDDPAWRDLARNAMSAAVRKHMGNSPLAYDIRDELSTTISANPFDYDFSPTALAGFRDWLTTRYRDLAALNAEWETKFSNWDEVKPFTTDQIKNRMACGDAIPRGKPDWQALQQIQLDPVEARKNPTGWNFAPWCDHRSYMDLSLARALGDLRETARALDPHTPVGIEGTQMASAFGGYDLWRLSQVLDWVEPYDIGNAREILGSFMPGKTMLTTVGEQDARAAGRRLWHLLLEGDKGCIIWWSEDCIDWKSAGYALTPRARALAPVLTEMRSPLARLFMLAERETDPVAIHYSQPSIQVNWLLESTVDGSTWLRRFSSHEATHNRMAARRQAWVKLLQDAGYTPRFISGEQVEAGGLEKIRVLVLPDSLALTDAELARFDGFLDTSPPGRLLLGSGMPGLFNGNGRLRAEHDFKPLRGLSVSATGTWFANRDPQGSGHGVIAGDIARELSLRKGVVEELPHGGRRDGTNPYDSMSETEREETTAALAGEILTNQLRATIPPPVAVPRRANIRTHRYQLGSARLLAFERNIVWQMGENLKQAGGNEALEKPLEFQAKLAAPAHVHDLRTNTYLGYLEVIPVKLDPWKPSLFALTRERLPAGDFAAHLSDGR
jgi:hypothetical protein